MKTFVLIASLIVVGFSSYSIMTKSSSVYNESEAPILISCITFPWCGGTDSTSPIVPPKDPNTETQDAKDEKVA